MLTDSLSNGGNESVAVTAGIWGFLVLFGLAIACWLLFRSMNNHLRKSQWQQEQDHPVRQRIPNAPRPQKPAPDASDREGSPERGTEQGGADDDGTA